MALLGLEAAFYLQALFAVAALTTLAARTVPMDGTQSSRGRLTRHLLHHVGRQKRLMTTVAAVSVVIQVLRSAREAHLPLWGDAISLSASQVALIFAAMSIAEVLVFYPAGVVSDRWGRKWAAIPCLTILAAGIALVPLTTAFATLVGVAVIIGVGNGFGAGIQMTLGSDLAPPEARAPFLGLWRLGADTGAVAGPSVIAAATSTAGLAFAAVAVAGIGFGGIVVMALLVPETLRARAGGA